MEEKAKQEKEQNSAPITTMLDGTLFQMEIGSDIVNSKALSFLKEKFNIVGEGAVDLLSKLPKTIIDKIESFDGEGLSSIASSISEAVESIDFPDIDLPNIDF